MTAKKIFFFKSFFAFAYLLLQSPFPLTAEPKKVDGFSTELIHRDSMIQNSSAATNHWELVSKSIQRSNRRANYLSLMSSNSLALDDLKASDADFLMKMSLGTPPIEINGIADTTSALIWTQCLPCHKCFPQNLPLFDPVKSATYKSVPGNSKQCKILLGKSSGRDNTCLYSVKYPDHSYSRGILSTDKLTVSSDFISSASNFVFGCGNTNTGKFSKETTGVIGLGYGPGSFINQMNTVIGGRFAYCLLSHSYMAQNPKSSSTIYFGSKARIVSGSGSVSTGVKVFKNSYALKLKNISVGKKRLISITTTRPFNSSSKLWWFGKERIIVDSGSVLSYLPKKFYDPLEAAVRREIKSESVSMTNGLRLCYKTIGGKMSSAPSVTVHFDGAADVVLRPENVFLRVREDVSCLGFVGRDGGVAILGNLAQRNFMVRFDLRKKIVSFTPTDCSYMGR